MKKAFVKLYDHAEDSELDKISLYEEALEATDDPHLRRQLQIAEHDRLGHDEKFKAYWRAKYNRECGFGSD